MHQLFSRILVPVKFNKNTPLLMNKAVELANFFNADLHILYVQTSSAAASFFFDGHFTGPLFRPSYRDSTEKMEKLSEEYREQLREGLLFSTAVLEGSWQLQLKEEIIRRQIDLVLIPRNQHPVPGALIREININRLARQTQCPVLTVTRAMDITQIRNIVVPVYDHIPLKKLTVATYLAKKFNGIIHLMGGYRGSNPEEKRNLRCMTKSYQLIRDYSNVRVYCAAAESGEEAAGTLNYANQVKADLIVVTPGKESRLRGWFSRWLGKYLYRESGIPVLTVGTLP